MVQKIAKQSREPEPRRIIGISLSPTLARKVKAEAVRRDLKLKELFEEMWALYEKYTPMDKS